MRQNIVDDIQQHFRNKVLNILGIERDIYTLLEDRDVDRALELMQDRDEEVDNALREYNPQQHKVMSRPNKKRDHDKDYITEKLPRNLQSYINEVELFFLLGQPILWKKKKGEDEAFSLYLDFWKKHRMNSKMRKVKRLAGAETEAALVFHMHNEEGKIVAIPFVAARSTGYFLRPLFDQFGQLKAFAYGYNLRESSGDGKNVNVYHWDFLTPEYIYYCKRGRMGWEVETYANPIGKIPAIYFQQKKPWHGVEKRLDRIEDLDSKAADTNNYFSDPIAAATADVVQNLATPDKPGRLIQLTGSNSKFEYIVPPNASGSREAEKAELKATVLFDTFTPDFDVDKMRGLGTLSGAAIRNSFAIGYIKRDNLKEDYDEYADRLSSVIKEIVKVQNPAKTSMLDDLDIEHEYSDPFSADKEDRWGQIQSLYGSGVASLETVVGMLGLTDDPETEIARLHAAAIDAEWVKAEAAAAAGAPQKTDEEQDAENNGQ